MRMSRKRQSQRDTMSGSCRLPAVVLVLLNDAQERGLSRGLSIGC